MADELSSFIDTVYRKPYSLIGNNCLIKSLRIKSRAEKLRRRADLIFCLAISPVKKWHSLPLIIPHFYTEIEGEKVDVALDPRREEVYCKNSEQERVMPVNISRIRRSLCREESNGY